MKAHKNYTYPLSNFVVCIIRDGQMLYNMKPRFIKHQALSTTVCECKVAYDKVGDMQYMHIEDRSIIC